MSKGLNRREVHEKVREYIRDIELGKSRGVLRNYLLIDEVFEDLSIFDWFKDRLTLTDLRKMDKFLTVAGEMGYNGYVCFKVGAKYCANGMWANKKESVDGHSPDGEVLWHSFRTGDNDWDVCLPNGKWLHDLDGRCDHTLKDVKAALVA